MAELLHLYRIERNDIYMETRSMMELGTELDLQFDSLVENCLRSGQINQDLYSKYDVKRGLRDSNGKGVLTGLTEVSDVVSNKIVDGKTVPIE